MQPPLTDHPLPHAAPSPQRHLQRLLLLLLPLLVTGSILLATWPGYLSFDSAYQFWQARSGRFGDIAPPLLPLLWRGALLAGLPGPSGPLLLNGLLVAIGFGGIGLHAARQGHRRLAWAVVLFGPACPVLVVLLPHIWTDVLLAGAALACVAVLLLTPARQLAAGPLIAALLFAVVALRHNGLLAAAPLALWWVIRWWPALGRVRTLAAAALILLTLTAAASLLRRAVVETRLDTWAVTLLYDLQAVSVVTGEQRIPASLVGPGLTVDELRAAFHPYSATRLFAATESGVTDPTIVALSPAQRADLLAAWRQLPAEPDYWRHRWRLMRGLLGDQHGELAGLAESPALTPYADNPPLQRRFPALHDLYRALAGVLHRLSLYSAGALWLSSLLLSPLLVRRRGTTYRIAVAALLGSASLYALPFLLIAPSAELRYLLWPAVAGWLALLLAAFAPTSTKLQERAPSRPLPSLREGRGALDGAY